MIHYSLLSSKNVFMGLVAYNSVYVRDMSSGILLHKNTTFFGIWVSTEPPKYQNVFLRNPNLRYDLKIRLMDYL